MAMSELEGKTVISINMIEMKLLTAVDPVDGETAGRRIMIRRRGDHVRQIPLTIDGQRRLQPVSLTEQQTVLRGKMGKLCGR
ncbi:hypothetical protein M569_04860 [Genlisea aurea]|uniref:Uncharacterized protein n=1 Tax=Genlisea aurea TaxID=192259 RepID=S8CRQ8_9LAMI|nr:hypothetical protein M569_04860 [Genlisea aurea]